MISIFPFLLISVFALGAKSTSTNDITVPMISLDLEKKVVSSPFYEYYFHPKNHLLIQKFYYIDNIVKVKRNSNLQAPITKTISTFTPNKYLLIKDGNVLIHLNIKNFFNLNITNQDIRSELLSVTNSSNGNNRFTSDDDLPNTLQDPHYIKEKISFYYKLLFFKLRLKMDTTLSFFTDKAHLPMTIEVPTSGPKLLNSGSGLLYCWQNEQIEFTNLGSTETLPLVDPSLISKGYESLAKLGIGYCKDSNCRFTIKAKVGQKFFQIEVSIPEELVKRGFFPMWVKDINDLTSKIKWPSACESDESNSTTRPSSSKNSALYFEVSGLEAGQYVIDYWIRIKN